MNRLQLQLYSGTSEPGEGGEWGGGVLPVMAYINERMGISLAEVYEKA